jgi:glyoxylase-like metal-dependent hydrolase (beta-lactamase superfamily II)
LNEISWVVLTLGHLSMYGFWGETERRRGALCTSVLVRTAEGLVIIDPSLPAAEMPRLLMDRAGVTPEDVRHVFLTHFHGDHRFGIEAFPHADWRMAEPETAFWHERGGDAERRLLDRLLPAGEEPYPEVRTLFLPGHTPGLTGLQFEWRGQRLVIAADAAMTEEFFWRREGYHNSTDPEQARTSIDCLAREADLVIPGHGNVFQTCLAPGRNAWTGGPPHPTADAMLP